MPARWRADVSAIERAGLRHRQKNAYVRAWNILDQFARLRRNHEGGEHRGAGGVRGAVGFHDADSFGRAFYAGFGVTPNHYRSRFLAPRKRIYSQQSLN